MKIEISIHQLELPDFIFIQINIQLELEIKIISLRIKNIIQPRENNIQPIKTSNLLMKLPVISAGSA